LDDPNVSVTDLLRIRDNTFDSQARGAIILQKKYSIAANQP
jgi:hypothetical protein